MTSIKTILITIILMGLLLAACQSKPHNVLKVGTIGGSEAQLLSVAKDYAQKKFGLDIEIVQYNDYSEPNAALYAGKIDANAFQHQPFLDAEIKAKHYTNLVPVAKTFVFPMGIYSKKINHLNDLKTGDIIAIPADPSNEDRALRLLNTAGVISLKTNNGTLTTTANITSNPKKIVFKKMAVEDMPAALDDLAAAAINTNYAVSVGLYPDHDAIFLGNKNSPYANVIVVRYDMINNTKVRELIAAMHSTEVIEAAQQLFKGEAFPAW